ncbi:ATP synthase subunit I [Sphingobium yanoikuyae]|nr:ATP synthase subunit I [Sphingobium yanoikuyae]PHP21600.1 ATP synthase subunit I [Sphingobium sp. IP1]
MTIFFAILFLMLGAMVGTVHFALIAKDADLLVHGGSALMAIALRIARMLLTAGVLISAALQGLPTLLAATIGFLMARQLVLRRVQVKA